MSLNIFEEKRRSFLRSVGGLSISQMLPLGIDEGHGIARQGYVLDASEGEHLTHFRDRGNIFIKVGSATGSENLALGTQQVMVGTGIPIHRHFTMDESFFVLEGRWIFILNEVRHSFENGGTIFIPKNNWHGFEKSRARTPVALGCLPCWPGRFFRDTCNPPGVPPKQLTREQLKEIGLKYDTEFR